MSAPFFSNWTEAVSYLNEKINKQKIIAGRNIQTENTGYGVRINGSAESSPGDGFNGMFKILNTSTKESQKLKIIDGMKMYEGFAGSFMVNDRLIGVPEVEVEIAANNRYLVIELKNTLQVITAEIKAMEVIPTQSTPGIGYILLCRIIMKDGKISKIGRQIVPWQNYIIGNCINE